MSWIKRIYYHPWFPRILTKKYDGGPKSGVTGYFLIEWKKVFSVGLLHFKEGSRENYHSHAFNAFSWWLSGKVKEKQLVEDQAHWRLLPIDGDEYSPSLKPKYTPRCLIHKVIALTSTWALTFRGPWKDTWFEVTPEYEVITLTHGRKRLND